MKTLILIFFAMASFAQTSEQPVISKAMLDMLAGQYMVQANTSKHRPRYCDEDEDTSSQSCIDAVCGKLGRYGCDDMSEIQQVGKACRGNRDGSCIESICSKLGRYGCDDMSEVVAVARSCKHNYGAECIDNLCTHLGRYGCDDQSEVTQIAAACRGADGGCVNSVCERVGRYGCDDMSEAIAVAESCGGN